MTKTNRYMIEKNGGNTPIVQLAFAYTNLICNNAKHKKITLLVPVIDRFEYSSAAEYLRTYDKSFIGKLSNNKTIKYHNRTLCLIDLNILDFNESYDFILALDVEKLSCLTSIKIKDLLIVPRDEHEGTSAGLLYNTQILCKQPWKIGSITSCAD